MLEPDCTVGLSLSGALTPAGMGMSCLIPLIRAGFVDWIVSTGANLYHDTHYALDLPLHQSRPNLDDYALRENAIIRIYDIVFDYKTLLDTDTFYRELIRSEPFARSMGTAEFHHEVGRYLHARAEALGRPANSLLAAAFECGRADLHVEPRRQLDRDEPGGAELPRLQAPDRHPPRRQRDRLDRLPGQAGRRQVGRPDPRRREPEELHPPDRAADPGSPRAGGGRARLLPPDHRRPPRHRRPLRGHRHRGDDLGQGRPREAPRLRHLLHRQHHRPAPADRLRPGPPRAPAPPSGSTTAARPATTSSATPTSPGSPSEPSAEAGRRPRSEAAVPTTRVIRVDPDEPDPAAIAEAAAILRAGRPGRLRHRDGLRPRGRRHQPRGRRPDLRGQGPAVDQPPDRPRRRRGRRPRLRGRPGPTGPRSSPSGSGPARSPWSCPGRRSSPTSSPPARTPSASASRGPRSPGA